MGTQESSAALDRETTRHIQFRARTLIGSYGFTREDYHDLVQDLTLDVLRRLRHFDPDRSSRRTFLSRVIDHRIATLVEHQKAGKRDYRLCRDSLNDPITYHGHRITNAAGDSIERQERYDQDDYYRQTGRRWRSTEQMQELQIDVSRAVEGLPPELRKLCQRLRTQSVSEVAGATGIPRSTLYDRIAEVRAYLEDRGLREYL